MASVEEIFSKLASHMIEGLMMHDQLASYFLFLNLNGYAIWQEHQYWCESKNYLCLKQYYIKHHGKLLKESPVSDPKIIPNSWLNYIKENVDIGTKRSSVKTALEKWIKWEKTTKEMYEQAFSDLMALNEIKDACFIKCFIEDTSDELSAIKEFYIEKQDNDFSMSSILADQEKYKHKYEE